jgi:hypothetical protein
MLADKEATRSHTWHPRLRHGQRECDLSRRTLHRQTHLAIGLESGRAKPGIGCCLQPPASGSIDSPRRIPGRLQAELASIARYQLLIVDEAGSIHSEAVNLFRSARFKPV